MLLGKREEYIGFSVYRRSYLLWLPVIASDQDPSFTYTKTYVFQYVYYSKHMWP